MSALHYWGFIDEQEFLVEYSDIENEDVLRSVQELLKPYLLSRTKNMVEKNLPTKKETMINIGLSHLQKIGI